MASTRTDDVTICSICNDVLNHPELLPCLHTFCRTCINTRWIATGIPVNATCFTCNEIFRISELKPNTFFTRLAQIQKLKTADHVCIVCQFRQATEKATHHCVDCGDMLCDPCSGHHTYTRLTLDHRVVKLTEIQLGKYDDAILQQQFQKCSQHPDVVLRYFCNTCCCPACEQCLSEHRTHHDVVTKEEALKSSKLTDIKKLYAELQPRLLETIDSYGLVERGMKQIENDEIEIPRKIQSFCHKIKNLVVKKEKEAQQVAATELTNIKQNLLAQKSEVDIYLEKIESTFHICKELLSGGNSLQILPIENMLMNKLLSLRDIKQPSDILVRETLSVEFQTSLNDTMHLASFTHSNVRQPEDRNLQYDSACVSNTCTSSIPSMQNTAPGQPKHPTSPVECAPQVPSVHQLRKSQSLPCGIDTINQQPLVVKSVRQCFKAKRKTNQPSVATEAKTKQTVIRGNMSTYLHDRSGNMSLMKEDTAIIKSGKEYPQGANIPKQESIAAAKLPYNVPEYDILKQPSPADTTNKPKTSTKMDANADSKKNAAQKKTNQKTKGVRVVNKYTLVRCFPMETSADTLEPEISSVAWVNSDSFVVCDTKNNKLTLFNTSGELVWSTPMDSPFDVACVEEVVACSTKGHIKLFKNKKLINTIKVQSNVTPLLTSTDGNFLATVSYNKRHIQHIWGKIRGDCCTKSM